MAGAKWALHTVAAVENRNLLNGRFLVPIGIASFFDFIELDTILA
jgi:hypothetical protein